MAINNNAGFVVPNKKEKTPSLDERIASDSGRAKQDMQAAKEREADKGRVIRQVQGAKSDLSMTGSDPYKKSSNSVADQIPTEAPKAKSSELTKEELSAESSVPYKGQTAKKAVKKAAPTVQAPSQEDIDRGKRIKDNEKFFAARGAFKGTEGMKKGGAVKKAYKAGGAVKSGASRGDGCAQRGRTRGTMR